MHASDHRTARPRDHWGRTWAFELYGRRPRSLIETEGDRIETEGDLKSLGVLLYRMIIL